MQTLTLGSAYVTPLSPVFAGDVLIDAQGKVYTIVKTGNVFKLLCDNQLQAFFKYYELVRWINRQYVE